MIARSRELLNADGLPPIEMLRGALEEHMESVPRLDMLARVYEGKNAILRRARPEGLPNNRIAHPFARYIVAVATGYMVGNGVTYREEAESEAFSEVMQAYRRGNMASVDAENAKSASIFGRGVEYVHLDADGTPHATSLDPRQAFVVYDDTYDMEPLFGVYIAPIRTASGAQEGVRMWVMGESAVMRLRADSVSASEFVLEDISPHFFGGVPLVEYWNDEHEKGDFEWVIPLIDAYDRLQSDRMNDKDQFVDALLVLTGCTLETDARGREPWRQLREDKAICLPDTGAGANYLHNQMDEKGNQILRDALAEDIHRFSMVPDLSDEHFAQNASGVAMRYKLWGLEQLTAVKRQWFEEGLRARLKLMLQYYSLRGYRLPDARDICVCFTSALPPAEEAKG